MEAKLIKRPNGIRWDLYLKKDINMLDTIASTEDGAVGKLSLKNCQAIENGYDLDELVMGYDLYENINFVGQMRAFKAGFQKALEILGDKKFSEEQLKVAADWYFETKGKKSIDEYIQSLQQTEWDVEIVMDKDCYSSAGRCDNSTMVDCIICTPVTYLKDADGCLILKRI